MKPSWNDLRHGPWPDTAQVPQQPPDERTRARRGLPKTLRPVPGKGVTQRPVFDPSLKHHPNAMRAGDPQFEDRETGRRWYQARRTAVDQILAAVAGSTWVDHLVLRGSTLLRAWYGDAAREPGDLDFVVVPESWQLAEHRTVRLFDDIARRAERLGDEVKIAAGGAVSEDIWTYDRVPGRRLILPWTAGGLPPGSVQLDFVFNEHLPAAPEQTLVPRSGGADPVLLNAATPELSLAWKLVWLLTDAYPQGKDLYDAVLLAERTPLSHRLLREALIVNDAVYVRRDVTLEEISALQIDWHEFRKEYPHLAGPAPDHLRRLVTALTPTFAQPFEQPGGAYERSVRWHAWRISACRGLLAEQGLPAVLEHLAGPGLYFVDAVAIVRELLGPQTHSPQDVAAILLRNPRWNGYAGYYQRNPSRLSAELDSLRDR